MVKHAFFKGHRFPDEVANEYVTRLLQGLHKKATIGQAYIDITRTHLNLRSKHKEAIINLEYGSSNSDTLNVVTETPIDQAENRLALHSALSKITDERTQQIFGMLLEGYTYKKIAKRYKLTEGRIQQIIAKEIEYLKAVL